MSPVRDKQFMIYKIISYRVLIKVGAVLTADLRLSLDNLSLTG